MAVLIANIGTSDLAIKIGKNFFPIGFDRNEPSLDYTGLTDDEKKVWNNRETLIAQEFCPKIGVQAKILESGKYLISFRELTQKILELYKNYEGDYKDLDTTICPIRIFGVIKKAYEEFEVRSGYIFITAQKPEHHQDTVYLFEILQKWLKNNLQNFQLNPVLIPDSLKPIDQDALLNYYYEFLSQLRQQINENEEILVSSKGGTPQMQNALMLQATALGIPRLLFIDPDPRFLIKRVLTGQPPECNLRSYWKYFRQQKYQTVQQLLERWDFDGAINILNQWQEGLNFLQNHQVMELQAIQQSSQTVEVVISILKIAHFSLDSDVEATRENFEHLIDLSQDENANLINFINPQKYDNILNLYTQSLMCRELRQVGNVLTTLASFYEIVLYRIIELSGGFAYLNQYDELKVNQLKRDIGQTLCQRFAQDIVQLTGNQNNRTKINTRRHMRTFITLLLNHRQVNKNINDINSWEVEPTDLSDSALVRGNQVKGLNGLLETLDYWVIQRNKLIHEGSGISIDRIAQLERQRWNDACAYDYIPEVLEKILTHPLLKLRREYKEQFVGTSQYYIYSAARELVKTSLLNDLKTR